MISQQHRSKPNTPRRLSFLVLRVAVLVATVANLQQLSAQSAVGDTVCAEGFPMDLFCIARGFLYDNPTVITLEGPDQHSVHCLIEVSECIGTPYEILLPPSSSTGLYTRGYRLDDTAKADVQVLAKAVGICGSCDGNGTIQRGLAVAVQGQIVQAASGDVPPTISGTVSLSDPSNPTCPAPSAPAPAPAATPTGTVPTTSLPSTAIPTGRPTSFSPTTVQPTALRASSPPTPTSQPMTITPMPISATPTAADASNSSSMPSSSVPTEGGGESPAAGNGTATSSGGGGSSSSPTSASSRSRTGIVVASMVVAVAAVSL